jgi:hypothetical protein
VIALVLMRNRVCVETILAGLIETSGDGLRNLDETDGVDGEFGAQLVHKNLQMGCPGAE